MYKCVDNGTTKQSLLSTRSVTITLDYSLMDCDGRAAAAQIIYLVALAAAARKARRESGSGKPRGANRSRSRK
jgi:hypothetical protein